MGFLRRILGGGSDDGDDGGGNRERDPDRERPDDAGRPGTDDEAARDRELLREDAARLDDELLQRQLRYADRSWTPPPQGGSKRAGEDDEGDA